MPSIKNGGNIEFGVSFKTDSSLDKLKKSLQDLQKVKLGDFKGSADDLDRVKETAQKVESILSRAFNPTLNTTNISTFNNELKKSDLTVEQIKSDFSQFGKEGQLAFSRMASSLLTTNLKLKQTNSLIDSMGKTMVNTVKWGIASSVMNTFTQSVQGAFQYVQSLEKSLTNIRIVTGDSTEKMAQFAEQANRSAQALGRSTLDYTKASLTFYQQGLNDEDVQARTEATLKAQNITGAGSQMADYLTSVWNGYKVANEEAELYVDKLAAVADSSASDMSQLAIAMSKVASTANTMGVDVDQLNAQIATVVATTRQAPESVGTAFKTIYTRMNDIKTGADDAEVSLGKYSGTMASLGFNVLDATGHLRDTGQVMEEIGGRWQTLTREQQIYLAQTMGGQRQVNQLMALFDNWTTYSELLNTSLESEGTLAEKNARYMESLGAKMEQLGAAGERVKNSLIDTDSMKGIVDILTNVTNLVATLFESIGGGNNVLLAFGSVATQVFGGTISKEIAHMIEGFQNAKTNAEILKNDIALTKTFENSQGENTKGLQFVQENIKELQKYYSILDESAINEQKNIIDRIGVLKDEQTQLQQNQNAVREYAERIGEVEESQATFNDSQNFSNTNTALGTLVDNARVLKQQYDILKNSGFTNDEELEKFKTHFEELLNDSENLGINVDKVRQAFNSGNWAEIGVSKVFDEAIQKGELFSTTINKSGNALEDTTNKINNLTSIMQSKQNSFETLFNVNNAIKFAATVGQIGSIMTSITNLGSIIKNEDLSASEKLAKVLTNIGFLLPMIINTSKNISSLLGITNALIQRRLFLEQKISKEKERQALLDKKAEIAEKAKVLQAQIKSGKGDTNKALQELKKFKNQDLHLDEQLESVDKYLISIKDKADKLPSTISTAFSAAGSSVSSFIGILGSIAVPLLAITAVVTAGYAIYKTYNQAADAAKQAAENAQSAKKQYDEMKDSFKNLTSAIEDYDNAKKALSELTKGTEQWYDKVNELNDKVLQLIQNFPELAQYIETDENGLLYFKENGEEEIKKIYRQRAYVSGMANASLQEKSYQADRTAKIVEQGRRIYGTGGMFGGQDIMEAVVSAVQKNGTAILANEDKLKKAVADEGVELNQDQIDATRENTQQIRTLVDSLNAEKTEVNALRDSLIKTNLNNEEEYRNSTHKDAFANMVAGLIEQERQNGLDEFYKEQEVSYGYGMNQQKTTQLLFDRDAAIKKYEELTGKEVKEKNGKFSARQAGTNDQFEEIKFSDITNYLREASINMEKIVADTTERMAAAQQNFASVSDRVKEVLFNSGLAGGFDKVNTNSLSQVDVNKLKSLNQNDLADFLGIDVKDIPSKLEELGANIQQGLDSFINGIEEGNTRAVMLQLKDKYGSDLSRELAEAIAQNVQDGYQKVGTESGNAIRDFYKKLSGDQVDDITKLAEEYNYAGNSAEDFIKAVRETGVTSEKISDDMVKAFYDAQLKIQDIQTKEYKTDFDKVNQANSTSSLGTQLNAGEKLSDKELVSYKEGLQDILKIYPELDKQVSILNNTQLAGTREYESALRDVKLALMSSYLAMGEMGKITSQDFTNQMMTLVTDTEMLQNLYQTGALNNEQFSTILQNLAVQYESCKDELAKYNTELRTGNEETQNAAAFNLMLATRSAENADKYGIQAQQISALANHYVELARSGNQAYQGMDQSSELAVDAATRYIRLNEAVQTLQKDYTKVTETLSALQNYDFGEVLGDADYAKTFVEIKKAVEDIIGIEEDLLDDDFIKQHAQEIKEAANGSEQAIISLQEAAAEEIWVNVNLDDEKFKEATQMSKQEFADWINNLPEGELSIDDTQMLETLANSLLEAGYTVADLQNMFEGAHLNIDMEADPSNVIEAANQAIAAVDSTAYDAQSVSSSQTQTDQQETGGYELIPHDQQGHFETPLFRESVTPFGVIPEYGGMQSHPFTYTEFTSKPDKQTQDISNVNTVTGVKIKHANKAPVGGQVSHKNKNGGNKKNTGGGGKKGGGGKGGSSKAKEPNKAKAATNKADRYRNNTIKANKLANQMTKLNKQQGRLTGKDSLKNLQKQLEVLEKQKDVIKERLGLQRDEQNELANNLKKYGATFDKDGTLNNYFTTHDKILKEYNDKVAEWNRMTAEQQESNKDYLNNAKEIMDQAFKDLERYDKLQQEIAKTQQEQIDKTQEQINLKVKQLDLKIKAELDLSEAKRDWNKFQKDIVNEIRDDDILGLNRFRFADIASYYNNAGTGSIQNLTNRLKEVMGDQNGIFSGSYFTQQLAKMSITDRAAQLEKVKEIFDDLQDQMEGFKEIADEIKESIFDAIDAAQDAFDEQMDEYEYLGDLIDHNMKITEMFFGDEAYDQMAKFYDRIEENNNAQLDFLAKQKDLWYSRMAEEQARMNQLAQTQGTDSNFYKEARDRFEEYKKHWMDTVKDLNSTVEDALDNIMDKYNNAINKILVNFELKLGDGHTLDDIEDEWDILNDQADRYFDKINAAYEIDKLENAFNDAINDNDGDIAAQQSLNDLMEQQLAYLRDKQRLTQYDVDRANALLQIEMKRLALEQSRSNKNRLRLRRDSQGNYTYQYTADTEAISKAEQELADAQNSLYNSDKAAYVDNLSDIQKSAENIKNKLEDIWTDENLSKEQKLQKSYELEKYYGDQINKLLEDNANIRNNLIQSSTEELAKIYGINIEQFQTLSDTEQTNILKDLIPQAGSYLSKMTEGLIGDGGIGKLFEDSINRFLQAEDERINSIAEIERNGQINFEDIINDTNTVIGQAEQLLDNNEALINSYEQELNAVQNTINGVNDLIQTYERAKQAAIQAATAANNFINQENVELIGSSLSREAAAQRANDNVLNSWVANGNSYGDLQNYTPYEPNWHSSDFAAIFGSSNVGLADLAAYQEALQNTGSTTGNIIGQSEYTLINVNSILDTIQSNVSHINDILEALHTESSNYYTNALNKAKDIERAIIANQTVHIDADFPNARDVSNIIDAINNLTLVAAQKAGKI